MQFPAPDRGQRQADGRYPRPGQRSDGPGQWQRGSGCRQRPAAHHGLPGHQVSAAGYYKSIRLKN